MAARRDYPDPEVFEKISDALPVLQQKDGRRLWQADGKYVVAGTIGQAKQGILEHLKLTPVVMTMEASMAALLEENNQK